MCCMPGRCCCFCFLLVLLVVLIGLVFGFGVFHHGFDKIKHSLHEDVKAARPFLGAAPAPF